MQLRPIDVDIEVFRFLESKRASFSQTHNDILRQIAGLPPVGSQPLRLVDADDASQAWTWKGASLPHGAQLRMSYNGRTHLGEIRNGAWHVGGATFHTPSAAAGGVARSKQGRPVSLDGWLYWEYQLPGSHRWRGLRELRRKAS